MFFFYLSGNRANTGEDIPPVLMLELTQELKNFIKDGKCAL